MFAIATFALIFASCEENQNDDTDGSSAVEIHSIKLDFNAKSLVAGYNDTLTVTLRPADAPEETLTWSSSDDSIATVVSIGALSGEIRALKAGTAIITVTTSNRLIDICEVTVKDFVALTGISIAPKGPVLIETGKTDTLIAMRGPANATNFSPVWTSSNTNAVTVSKTGVITAVNQGTATVTVASGDISASVEVQVWPSLTDIILTPEGPITIDLDTESAFRQLTATPFPANALHYTPVWRSSHPSIATVSQTGEVKAINVGTVLISVTSGEVSKSVEITITSNNPIVKYATGEWTAESRGGNHPWGDMGGEPRYLFDGDFFVGWHSNTGNPIPQCLVIDMKETLSIYEIILHPPTLDNVHAAGEDYNEWCYLQDIEIYLSDTYVDPNSDPSNWGEPVDWVRYSGPPTGEPFSIIWEETRSAQYLILLFTSSRVEPYISLMEIEVYGRR